MTDPAAPAPPITGAANTYPREQADVNNDGLTDIVGFGIAGVLVAINQGDFLL